MKHKLIAIQVLTTSLLCGLTASTKWSDCANKSVHSAIQWQNLVISPQPLKMSQKLYFGAKISINKNITQNSISKVEIWRRIKSIQIPFLGTPELMVPCISGFGSCEDSFCPLLKHQLLCSFFAKSNHTCDCQLNSGTYEAYDIPLEIPSGSQFLTFLTKGSYLLKWQILTSNREVLGCLKMETDVKP